MSSEFLIEKSLQLQVTKKNDSSAIHIFLKKSTVHFAMERAKLREILFYKKKKNMLVQINKSLTDTLSPFALA